MSEEEMQLFNDANLEHFFFSIAVCKHCNIMPLSVNTGFIIYLRLKLHAGYDLKTNERCQYIYIIQLMNFAFSRNASVVYIPR